MQQIDYWIYIQTIGTLLIISPLVLGCFSLDHVLLTAILLTIGVYIIISILCIIMLNYLSTGNAFKAIRK